MSKEEFSGYSAWACTDFSTQAIIKPAKEVTQKEEAPGKWLYKDRSKEAKGEQGVSTDDFVREVKRQDFLSDKLGHHLMRAQQSVIS